LSPKRNSRDHGRDHREKEWLTPKQNGSSSPKRLSQDQDKNQRRKKCLTRKRRGSSSLKRIILANAIKQQTEMKSADGSSAFSVDLPEKRPELVDLIDDPRHETPRNRANAAPIRKRKKDLVNKTRFYLDLDKILN